MGKKTRLKIGVIGCGYWGPNLIRNFKALPECEMSICADLHESNRFRMSRLYPDVRVTADHKEIVGNDTISAVAIATPAHLHYPLAKECLLAGKHVLVEKPLATTSEECLGMINLAQKAGKILMVGHTFEYSPGVNKTKEILASGELGEILYARCARLNLGLFQSDINVIWDLAPHDISILLYLLGKPCVAVNGQGKAHYFKNIEDIATATLHFADGKFATVETSWLDPYKIRRMTLVGTKKMLVYDDIHPSEKIKIFDKGVDVPPYYDTFGDFQFAYRYGDIASPRIEDGEPVRIECQHFIDCIKENRTPRSDGFSGLRVVGILEAICSSIKQNGALVRLNDSHPDEASLTNGSKNSLAANN